jgi:DNA repair protein RadA/Sms
LKEAAKLGFSQATVPSHSKIDGSAWHEVRQMPDLTAFVGEMFGAG